VEQPVPVVARTGSQVCCLSCAGIADSNPAGGHGCLSFMSVVCCQVEVSVSGWSLAQQRSSTECGVSSECDLENSWMRRPWPALGRSATGAGGGGGGVIMKLPLKIQGKVCWQFSSLVTLSTCDRHGYLFLHSTATDRYNKRGVSHNNNNNNNNNNKYFFKDSLIGHVQSEKCRV
jgi:hypothetical protein